MMMEPLLFLARLGFYVTTILTVAAAVMVVTLRNIFHSALALILTLLGIAVTYIYLRAEFLAMIQILLYVGAIMTLVIFAIMLTSRIGDRTIPQTNGQSLYALGALLLFNVLLVAGVLKTSWPLNPLAREVNVDARLLGLFLMKDYVFPFEIVSVVLIVALVGAIILGRSDQ